jgi:ABC-type bacteriocin/lantibiotic exporter with double-glycine peptidase domain
LVLSNNIIIPAGTIISEALILLLLFIAVTFYNVTAFLFIVVILSPILLFYLYRRKRAKVISDRIKNLYPRLLKHTLQTIEGLVEIRSFHKESFFKERFNQTYKELGKVFSTDHTVQTSTLRTTELIAAVGICTLIIYTLFSGQSYEQSVLLLSIYAGVSFRAIPSVNRIIGAFMQMKSHEYVVQELNQLVVSNDELFIEDTEPLPFNHRIEIKNISFRYEGQPWVLRKASITIRKGERVILTGKSGIGKTTLFLIMMRLLKEQEGEIYVDGKILDAEHMHSWRRLIGYVPQHPYILDASVMENVAFGVPLEEIDTVRVKKIVHDLDLEQWITSLPESLNTIIGEKGIKVSGGQRQRLAIARALYHDAQILLLDEITNQLDRETELAIMRSLQNLVAENKTIILITHRSELFESADAIYEIKEGTVEKIPLPIPIK